MCIWHAPPCTQPLCSRREAMIRSGLLFLEDVEEASALLLGKGEPARAGRKRLTMLSSSGGCSRVARSRAARCLRQAPSSAVLRRYFRDDCLTEPATSAVEFKWGTRHVKPSTTKLSLGRQWKTLHPASAATRTPSLGQWQLFEPLQCARKVLCSSVASACPATPARTQARGPGFFWRGLCLATG